LPHQEEAGVEGERRWGIAGAGRVRPPELDAGDGRRGSSRRAVLRAAVDGEAITRLPCVGLLIGAEWADWAKLNSTSVFFLRDAAELDTITLVYSEGLGGKQNFAV